MVNLRVDAGIIRLKTSVFAAEQKTPGRWWGLKNLLLVRTHRKLHVIKGMQEKRQILEILLCFTLPRPGD